MKNFIKAYWKTLLFFMVVGLIGGFFTGIYLLDSYPPDIRQQLLDSIDSDHDPALILHTSYRLCETGAV